MHHHITPVIHILVLLCLVASGESQYATGVTAPGPPGYGPSSSHVPVTDPPHVPGPSYTAAPVVGPAPGGYSVEPSGYNVKPPTNYGGGSAVVGGHVTTGGGGGYVATGGSGGTGGYGSGTHTGSGYGTGSRYTNKGSQCVTTNDGCFCISTNRMIINAQPFERRSLISVQQCQQNCLAQQDSNSYYQCKSLVYDSKTMVCDLFAHTGSASPAKVVAYTYKHYYEYLPGCGGGTGGPGTGGTGSSSCASGQVVRYARIQRVELVGEDTIVTNSVDQRACLEACSSNLAPNGQSISCLSLDYDAASRTCKLSTNAGEPTGSGQLAASSGSDYYEKLCVSGSSATGCPDVFDRVPQMVLLGFAENVVTARTLQDCVDQCLNARQLFGTSCRSAQYYIEIQGDNCIINSVSRTTNPDLFVPEDFDSVDYIEPNCNNRQLSPRDDTRESLDDSEQFFGQLTGISTRRIRGTTCVGGPQFQRHSLRWPPAD